MKSQDNTALAALGSWWHALALRERRLLAGAGAIVVFVLLWSLALRPALRTITQAPAELDWLEVQLQTMQRLAAEAGTLRAAPAINPEQAAAALRAATERLGDKGKLLVQGDRATLTLAGVGTADLRDWLAEARSGARARPLEATLTRGAQGYNGTLVMTIGGAS
jgi:general secretion pathway protein M